jgi:hypothetical protein
MTTARRNGVRPPAEFSCEPLGGVSVMPDGLLAFRPMLRGSVGPSQIMRGVDQRDMREGLRVVAHLLACPRIVFFGEQTDIVAEREEPLEQRASVMMPILQM